MKTRLTVYELPIMEIDYDHVRELIDNGLECWPVTIGKWNFPPDSKVKYIPFFIDFGCSIDAEGIVEEIIKRGLIAPGFVEISHFIEENRKAWGMAVAEKYSIVAISKIQNSFLSVIYSKYRQLDVKQVASDEFWNKNNYFLALRKIK